MKTIAVDLDDVLAASAEGFIAFSNERWGTTLTVDDYDEHWAQMWGVDMDELKRRSDIFHDSGVAATYAHKESALPVLRELAKTYRIVVVTARRKTMEADTLAWLDAAYGQIFTAVHFAGIWDTLAHDSHLQTKAAICQTLGVDYLIDDQLKHCLAVAECGISTVLFGNYGWNQAATLPAGITRCRDWLEVAEYFRQHG